MHELDFRVTEKEVWIILWTEIGKDGVHNPEYDKRIESIIQKGE